MSENYQSKYLAAAVQMAPVWLDREATTQKVCDKIRELGKQGVRLIVFPETVVPGTPHWIWFEPANRELFLRLFTNAVEIPGPTIDAVSQACRNANAYVILGVHERYGKALYNSLVHIDEQGEVVNVHRKVIATHSEKVIWAGGDGAGLKTVQTSFGKVGGLICAEHNMSLPRHALAQQGEEVHAAVFISGSARRGEEFNTWVDTWCRSYALANQTYVVCAQSVATEEEIERFNLLGPGGGSSIIAPDGTYLAGPLLEVEGDIIAEIDRVQGMQLYSLFDTVGYHGRPDIFDLRVSQSRPSRNLSAPAPASLTAQ